MNNTLWLSLSALLILPLAHATPNMSPVIDMTSQVTNQVSRSVSSGVAKNLFDNLIIPELKIKNSSGVVKQMQVSVDQHFLSLLLADGSTRVWDLDLGVQRPMIIDNQTQRIAVDAQQQIIFTANAKGIMSYDVLTAKPRATFPLSVGEIHDLAISADGSLLLLKSADQQLSLWNTQTHKMLWQQADFVGTLGKINFLNSHPDSISVVCHQNNSSGDALEIRDIFTGKKIQTLSNKGENILFSQINSDSAIEIGYGNGESIIWDLKTGVPLSTTKIAQDKRIAMDKMNAVDASLLEDGSVLMTQTDSAKSITIRKENNPIVAVALLAEGKKLITATESGQLFLWNVADGKELLQLISTKQGWTVVDNTGRFDSSELGMPNVTWQAGEQVIPFDNIATRYYEPGLFASALNNDAYLIAQPNPIQNGITLPPKVEVSINKARNVGDDVELTVDIYDQGGGIDAVNLYHNEKAINLQRSVISDKTVKQQDKDRRTMTVKLQPTAGENEVKAIVSNKMGIENQSDKALFNAAIVAKLPKLRLATIGINEYRDKKLNLDYSVADAQSIKQLLMQTSFAKQTAVNQKQLHNQNATKAAILSTLRELSNGHQADVLAIYFAGHGISVNGEWYFLPYETTLHADLNYFASVGVSASEISDIFKDSPIQHILLMIDACYSGASLDSFKKLQNSQRKFSRTISRSVGITIVTATRKNQQAAELSDLGHGLFTYVLGKGMRGEADFMPQNNEISAHELANFSTRTIPSFSKRYIGSAQEPTSFTMGKDFILFDKK